MFQKALLIFILFPLQIYAQTSLKGIVIDSATTKPIKYASVYINGTTIGTITNPEGKFNLENITFPCEIIISHISYYPKSFTIQKETNRSHVAQ